MYFSWSNVREYSRPWEGGEYTSEAMCEKTIYPYLPVNFLACAVLLNVNKWIYCLMHISYYSKDPVSDPKQPDSAAQAGYAGMIRLNMKKQLLNMATIGVIGLYLFYNMAYFMYGCIAEFDSHHEYE